MKRRTFLHQVAGLPWIAVPRWPGFAQAPAIVTPDRQRPLIDAGVSAGPLGRDGAIIWAHVDRPAQMMVEYATNSSFTNAQRVNGSLATPDTGLTARARIGALAPGQDVFYRVRFETPGSRTISAPAEGHFRTTLLPDSPVRVVWTADVCGQGWGIDPARGGMRLFATMADAHPDLFVHVGDTIYADQPLQPEVRLDDGTLWKNIVTPSKAKVAETLDEFRGNHLYNRLDEHYRRFAAQVGQVTLWDDHEVRDNWYHEQLLPADAPYVEKRVAVLAQRARRALLEHYPVTMDRRADALIYRTVPVSPHLEVFSLDMRSYRGPNSDNVQPEATAATAFLGARQVRWLADALSASTATWKIVAADMPISVVVAHQPGRHEAVANGDRGAPLGRELEIAHLLRTLQQRRVHNVVWITADVHYCAAHHYDPSRAATPHFDPFWEFIAGPAHAGTFAPGALDPTFGPEVRFNGTPADLAPNRPPDAGLQFFGVLDCDPRTRQLTVALVNTAGTRLFTQALEAVA